MNAEGFIPEAARPQVTKTMALEAWIIAFFLDDQFEGKVRSKGSATKPCHGETGQ